MSPDYYRFIKSISVADQNVIILFGAALILLITYKSIDWYPVKWQKTTRIVAHFFAIFLLAASVYVSL